MPRQSLPKRERERAQSTSSLSASPAPAPIPKSTPTRARAPRASAARASTASKAQAQLESSGSESAASSDDSLSDAPAPKKARASKTPVKSAPKAKAAPKSKLKPKPKPKPSTSNGDAAIAGDLDVDVDVTVKPKKTPKSKAFPPPELDPSTHPARLGYPVFALPALTVPPNGGIGDRALNATRPLLLGAHTSIAGGVAGALLRAGRAGANGLGMFVKSQRQWKSNPFEEETVERWKSMWKAKEEGGMGYGPEAVLVHGSYLINLGNPDQAKWDQAYECFKDDLQRCHQLGLRLYNWHPGSTVGACTKEESYATIAKAINRAHVDVPDVITVVENMANAGSNIIGTTFADLAGIIALVTDKSRVRVCLDTCHLFAAGYDVRTPESYAAVMREFDAVVGNGYLGGMHFNDSKMGLGEKKDLHENIGLGKIGLSGFRAIMRDPLMAGIPLVLETPADGNALDVGELAIWMKEIELLYRIQAIDDADWAQQEEAITNEWRAERDKISPPKEKKAKGKKEA